MIQIMSYDEQIIANADCICHFDEADGPPLPLHDHSHEACNNMCTLTLPAGLSES